jgi:putative membrane-bound dehydrogenase-like protein
MTADIRAAWPLATLTGLLMALRGVAQTPLPDGVPPPLDPAAGLASIRVPPGFRVELAASEPEVMDPVAIDWDAEGRLWVVEMADYPEGIDGKGQPGGRVRVLEDRDGDGRHESSVLFAEGLSFPTGLLTWRDGVVVTAAPEILFLRDRDGDGRAEERRVLLEGLSEGNQQLRANGLRWGGDGRVYCAAGGHHGGHAADTELRGFGESVKIGSRDFSFHPDRGGIRAESGPSQFGRERDDEGHWFGTQNSRALWHYVLPDAALRRNPHVAAPDPTNLLVRPLNAPVFPASRPEARFHSFENAGHFTSACSGMIYRDDLLFPRVEGKRHAFSCEPFHNLVQHNVLSADGFSFTAERADDGAGHDFFASSDRWCRPVMVRTGPDGALWVVDMYRCLIEHPAWLPEKARADLLPQYRLGDDRGRIYRILPAKQAALKPPYPQAERADSVAGALASSNGWLRDRAQMVLNWLEGEPGAAVPREGLAAVVAGALASADPLTRVSALGTLPVDPSQEHFLRDPSAAVRLSMLRRLGEAPPGPSLIMAALPLARDPDAAVRLQFALSAGSWREAEGDRGRIGAALAECAAGAPDDDHLRAAVLSSAVPHFAALARAVSENGGSLLHAYAADLTGMALALQERDVLAALMRPAVSPAGGTITAEQCHALAALLDALAAGKESLPSLAAGKDDALATAVRMAEAVFPLAEIMLTSPGTTDGAKAAAAGLLMRQAGSRGRTLEEIRKWLEPSVDPVLQLGAVRAMAASDDEAVPRILLASLGNLAASTRQAALEVLLSREAWALALLGHLAAHPEAATDSVQRARLRQHASEAVRNRAAAVLAATPERSAAVAAFAPALALTGDPLKGLSVFTARCTACHQAAGRGTAIGPDLRSAAQHPPAKLLAGIIDPSLDVPPGYFAFTARLRDATELYGLVASETGNSVGFRLPDGSLRLVRRNDVVSLRSTGQSFMPAGLETGMNHQEMADLIAWIRAGAK